MIERNTSPGPAASPSKTGQRRRTWIWIFVVLTALGVLAVGINFGYNVQQQLSEAELQKARELWEQRGPRDYRLRVQVRRHSPVAGDLVHVENYSLVVRDRKVVEATVNDRELERRLWDEFDMNGLFDSIEEFLRQDRRPGQPPTFLKGTFDRKNGQLLKFIRRVRSSNQRLEIVVTLDSK
jgi:hypothetical protein